MFFLTSLYKKLKLGVGGLGLVGSLSMIIYGAITGGTGGIVLAVGGGLWLVQSGLTLFDGSKIYEEIKEQINLLKTNIDEFAIENDNLRINVSQLKDAKDTFIRENRKLVKNIEASEKQLVKLDDIKNEYQLELDKLDQENQDLEGSLDRLQQLQDDYRLENDMLKGLIKQNQDQILQMEAIKEKYVEENQILQENNQENSEQIEVLKSQVSKLKELYNNSRLLLKNLADAGDLFNEFGNTLGNTVTQIGETAQNIDETQEELDQTLDQMKMLVSKLQDSTFDEFDQNDDGIITAEEFTEATN